MDNRNSAAAVASAEASLKKINSNQLPKINTKHFSNMSTSFDIIIRELESGIRHIDEKVTSNEDDVARMEQMATELSATLDKQDREIKDIETHSGALASELRVLKELVHDLQASIDDTEKECSIGDFLLYGLVFLIPFVGPLFVRELAARIAKMEENKRTVQRTQEKICNIEGQINANSKELRIMTPNFLKHREQKRGVEHSIRSKENEVDNLGRFRSQLTHVQESAKLLRSRHTLLQQKVESPNELAEVGDLYAFFSDVSGMLNEVQVAQWITQPTGYAGYFLRPRRFRVKPMRIAVGEGLSPHRPMIKYSTVSQQEWRRGDSVNTMDWNRMMEFYAYPTKQPGTFRIAVGETRHSGLPMINHPLKTQKEWNRGASMNISGWNHVMEFWAYPKQHPGTVRIAVGSALGPTPCVMINHSSKTQQEWNDGASMDVIMGWRHMMEFWVYPGPGMRPQ